MLFYVQVLKETSLTFSLLIKTTKKMQEMKSRWKAGKLSMLLFIALPFLQVNV